jgi:hypothetical protein
MCRNTRGWTWRACSRRFVISSTLLRTNSAGRAMESSTPDSEAMLRIASTGPISSTRVRGIGVARSCMTVVTRSFHAPGSGAWSMAAARRWELPWWRSVHGQTMSASVLARRWARTWEPTKPAAPVSRIFMARRMPAPTR